MSSEQGPPASSREFVVFSCRPHALGSGRLRSLLLAESCSASPIAPLICGDASNRESALAVDTQRYIERIPGAETAL